MIDFFKDFNVWYITGIRYVLVFSFFMKISSIFLSSKKIRSWCLEDV